MEHIECAECGEVLLEDFQQRATFGFVARKQFGKGELYFVIADQPTAQFCVCRMSTYEQCLSQRFATRQSFVHRVCECGVAGAPRP